MILEFTKRFKRSYKKLDPSAQKIIHKTLQQLEVDFSHPSLRIKKMKGYQNTWEASGNMNIRITFEIEKPEKLILRNCGHHDETLRNP